jgi:hypothetical protein
VNTPSEGTRKDYTWAEGTTKNMAGGINGLKDDK